MNYFPARPGIGAVLLWAVLQVAAASHAGSPTDAGKVKIHIRLVNIAGIDDRLLVEAETLVRGMFRRSGVPVDFDAGGDGPAFWLQILRGRPKHLTPDATGMAVLVASPQSIDSYAAVWTAEVESAARTLGAPVVEVLAASMAHEIGHLALHSSRHTRGGIMSRRIDRQQIRLLERGELVFVEGDAERLTAILRTSAR